MLVTSVSPSSSGAEVTTTVTLSIDYIQLFGKPSLSFMSSLEQLLSLLPYSDILGGIPVDNNGTFGYQGFYLSSKQAYVDIILSIHVYKCISFARFLFMPE